MILTEYFFVQFKVDDILFEETLELAYRTEEWKKYWVDDILNKSHCHYQQAQSMVAKILKVRKSAVEIVTLIKTFK